MAIKTFVSGEVLTASDTNNYLNNGGLVYITQVSASGTTTSINNCFTTTYENYRIVINGTGFNSTVQAFSLRFRASGTDNSTNNYRSSNWYTTSAGSSGVTTDNPGTSLTLGYASSTNPNNSTIIDVFSPQIASQRTWGSFQRQEYDSTAYVNRNGGFFKDETTGFDGFSIIAAGSATFTGKIYVYGYRQS